MIRVAAVGDVHYDRNCRNRLRDYFSQLSERADLLLLAGDLTQKGYPDEIAALLYDLEAARVPVAAVLGNHDHHSGHSDEIRRRMEESGVHLLEAASRVFEVRGQRVGVAGLKGFGGGFANACVTEFGEPETKAFARHAKRQADLLRRTLESLDADYRFVLLHYSPIETTLLGEKREIYPFLGSYLLAEAIDAVGADCVFHGHAHYGTERGSTRAGVPVRNVAQPVIRHAYNVYTFDQPAQLRVAKTAASATDAWLGGQPGPG
jgi:Icc-related predicted phosphoesterase